MSAAISPRAVVRVAALDAETGWAINAYPHRAKLDGPAPSRPWAVHLADGAGAYRLVVFDLDAHGARCPGGADQVADEAAVLAGVLGDLGIEHVVCASGPSGGRHVWIALADPLSGRDAAVLAKLARSVCPSVDITPMSNPVAGCVRPPFSPHRDGGVSTVVSGEVAALAAPATTTAQIAALAGALGDLAPAAAGGAVVAGRAGARVLTDEHGHPHLAGARRRALPARAAAALAAPAGADASAALRRVLVGAAAARWRYADVAALAAMTSASPGLEHARTLRAGSRRTARPAHGSHSGQAVLARQWERAVRWVAAQRAQVGDDPTFAPRAAHVAAVVDALQRRADASAGYWDCGTGAAQRRVLDVLCAHALAGVCLSVEAAVRTLALRAGIGRESARRACHALAEHGWITADGEAVGVGAWRWKIGPPAVIHSHQDHQGSQADPRPSPTTAHPTDPAPVPGLGAAARDVALAELESKIAAFAHDAFTPRALGIAAGNAYAATTTPSSPMITGASRGEAHAIMTRLACSGLLSGGPVHYQRDPIDRRGAIAAHHGATATLTDRAVAYADERTAWAWWQAEQTWMSAPHRSSGARRPGAGQEELIAAPPAWSAHPRDRQGRCDYAAARSHIAAGRHVLTRPPERAARAAHAERAAPPPTGPPASRTHPTPAWVSARRREIAAT